MCKGMQLLQKSNLQRQKIYLRYAYRNKETAATQGHKAQAFPYSSCLRKESMTAKVSPYVGGGVVYVLHFCTLRRNRQKFWFSLCLL